jgi:hypothetical protein
LQFEYYTEKTVAQCLTAINARMQAKPTSTRPALDGWVEKSGRFSLGVTMPVIGRFKRTTYLQAKLERQGAVTQIAGSVSSGVPRDGQIVVYAALAVVVLVMVLSGSLYGWLLIPFGALLYIPMKGDDANSTLLLDEIQKTLKARARPPRKASESAAKPRATRASSSTASKRPAAAKSSAAGKRASSAAPRPALDKRATSQPAPAAASDAALVRPTTPPPTPAARPSAPARPATAPTSPAARPSAAPPEPRPLFMIDEPEIDEEDTGKLIR